MKIKATLLSALMVLLSVSALAQPSADARVESIWTFAKLSADTTTLDTVSMGYRSVGRSYASTIVGDTTYTIVGAFENRYDTCTITLQYRPVSPTGLPIAGAAWTTVGSVNGVVYLPQEFTPFTIALHPGTVFIEMRAFRGKGATQSVLNKNTVYLYNYYYAR